MLSFIPRILILLFGPSPVLVVSSSPTSLFNDDLKLSLSLPLPLPSPSSAPPLSALDQLRYVQAKFQIEATLLSAEKQATTSLIVVPETKKENKEAARGRKVGTGRCDLAPSSSPIPSCIKAAASKPLSDLKLQAEVDALLKLWKDEGVSDLEALEQRRRDLQRELFEQAAQKGLRWQKQRREVEEMMLASHSMFEEDDEEEELEPVVAFEEEEEEEEEAKEMRVDQEQSQLAKVAFANAACAGYAWRREMAWKRLHQAVSSGFLFCSLLLGGPCCFEISASRRNSS